MFKAKSPIKQGLDIIIVGCGKVGATLVERLSGEGHDITIIDKNEKKVQQMTDAYDVMGVVGNGASYSVQTDAGIESADLIVAVTESDELNLLCCIVAKQVGNCATIARVRTPDYSKEAAYIREKLGLTLIINPDLATAKEISRILYLPTALEVNAFAHGQAEMVKFKVPEDNLLDKKTVAFLGQNVAHDILICAIERNGNVSIPSGDSQILAGDIISFVASRNNTRQFLKDIGFNTTQVKDTIIVGGSKTAYYLAHGLIQAGISVKIIELDRKRCEELSVLLPKAVIINGDGTDQTLLKEEGIEYAESFIPLTSIDEENILLTLHAKDVSNAKIVTKIDRTNFKDVIEKLDLGSVIYPRYITSEAIIAYVRAKNNSKDSEIETLYHIFDSRAEAIEFRVDKASEVTDVTLSELPLKKNLLIAFIGRNGSIIIPSGQDCIKVGDTVMIVTTHTGFKDIRDILL